MEEKERLVPDETDENVGEEPSKKKKEKKRKSKEDVVRDRKTVMFVFVIVFLITLAFYIWPRLPLFKGIDGIKEIETPVWRNYSETEM